jgi:hypothetical protein
MAPESAGGSAGGSEGGTAGSGSGGAAGMPTGGTGGMAVAGVGGTGGATGEAGAGGDSSTQTPMLPPTDDYSAKGPFDTTIDENVGPGGGYTVFRPDPLADDGFLHAPIIFAAGITDEVSSHTELLTYFASHGFVVVGTPVLTGGPGDAGNRQKMLDGLNWILEQNEADGIYKGKLYVDHAISMGHSVGGTAAVEVGEHEAVATVVSIHGHNTTAELHGTMLQTTGTIEDINSQGVPYQQATYEMSQVPTFLATLSDAHHGYILSDAGGVERPAIVAWMRYWIYGDTGGKHYFFGDDCDLCSAPWENPQRKNWP